MSGHWKHEWVPLDPEAAKQKFHGRMPPGWHPPVREGGPHVPDLSHGLPPVPPDPGRYSGGDFNKAGMTGHLDALATRDALHSANKAAQLQKSGGSHQEIMQALAAAEQRAPAGEQRAYHASRLDAYANAHGLKGWYRHQSSTGGGTHMVQVNKVRTPAEGDKGRYYASDPFSKGSPQIVDRDTGKIVGQAADAKAAEARIKELESRNPPAKAEAAPARKLGSMAHGQTPERISAGQSNAAAISQAMAAKQAARVRMSKAGIPVPPTQGDMKPGAAADEYVRASELMYAGKYTEASAALEKAAATASERRDPQAAKRLAAYKAKLDKALAGQHSPANASRHDVFVERMHEMCRAVGLDLSR